MSAVFPLPTRVPQIPLDTSGRRAAYELAQAIAARPPIEELLRVAVAASRELFDADEAALCLSEPSAAALAFAGAPLISVAPAGSRAARRSAARVVYCAPLVVAGEPIGVLRLTNPAAGRTLEDADLLFLNSIARDLANALGAGRGGTPSPRDPSANVFSREGDFWTVAHAGELARVKHGKGMGQIALLLESPGREHHALDMVTANAAFARSAPASNDVLLDAESRRAYRSRIALLKETVDEARARNDAPRAACAETEIEFLLAELRRCVGLGGRPRAAASAAERARQNVTRSIRAAIRHLATHHAALARHFDRTIRTGLFCSYNPDPRVPIAWEL